MRAGLARTRKGKNSTKGLRGELQGRNEKQRKEIWVAKGERR